MAKHSKPKRKTVVLQPQVEVTSTVFLDLLAVCRTASVNMVNGKKFQLSFTTTGALVAIGIYRFNFESLVAVPRIFTKQVRMFCSIGHVAGTLLFNVGTIVGSRISPFTFGSFVHDLTATHSQSPQNMLEIV